jgi:phosphogluconate dehydratase
MIRLDAVAGVLEIEADLTARPSAQAPASGEGYGREMFSVFRQAVGAADEGASPFF